MAFHSPNGRRIFLTSPDGHLTANALPASDDYTFVIVARGEIQRFADDSGDFSYSEIYPATFVGDTATITITLTSAYRRPQHQGPVVKDGASSCEWLVVRRPGGWVLADPRNCIILD